MYDLDFKAVRLDHKSVKDGVIEGYASLFGEVDTGGDIVQRGAFAASLAAMSNTNRKVKMLWQHDPGHPIGVWDEVREDERGLYVKGRVLSEVAKGRDVLALIGAGAIDGLSIGYRTLQASRDAKGNRVLETLEIWEVSVVTFPMLQSARVDATKAAAMDKREFERKLTQDAGFSRSVARALMGGGVDAVKAMQDAGKGSDELAALLKARINLCH